MNKSLLCFVDSVVDETISKTVSSIHKEHPSMSSLNDMEKKYLDTLKKSILEEVWASLTGKDGLRKREGTPVAKEEEGSRTGSTSSSAEESACSPLKCDATLSNPPLPSTVVLPEKDIRQLHSASSSVDAIARAILDETTGQPPLPKKKTTPPPPQANKPEEEEPEHSGSSSRETSSRREATGAKKPLTKAAAAKLKEAQEFAMTQDEAIALIRSEERVVRCMRLITHGALGRHVCGAPSIEGEGYEARCPKCVSKPSTLKSVAESAGGAKKKPATKKASEEKKAPLTAPEEKKTAPEEKKTAQEEKKPQTEAPSVPLTEEKPTASVSLPEEEEEEEQTETRFGLPTHVPGVPILSDDMLPSPPTAFETSPVTPVPRVTKKTSSVAEMKAASSSKTAPKPPLATVAESVEKQTESAAVSSAPEFFEYSNMLFLKVSGTSLMVRVWIKINETLHSTVKGFSESERRNFIPLLFFEEGAEKTLVFRYMIETSSHSGKKEGKLRIIGKTEWENLQGSALSVKKIVDELDDITGEEEGIDETFDEISQKGICSQYKGGGNAYKIGD